MMTKTSLFRGAALGALIALGMGAAAQAKPVKHHVHHAAVSSAEEDEIAILKDQVEALSARLAATEAAQQQTQAVAQQATAAVQQVQVQSAQVDDQIRRIPGAVTTAVAALPKPKGGWWDNTTIGGRMFYDVTSIDQKNDGVKQPVNGVNFDIKRFYVQIDHKFNDVFSADITTDFTYDSGPAAATQLILKKAYLQAKVSDALVIRAGAADMPWVPFIEDLYGYRYVENVLIDRTKFGTSTDWGVHASGKLPAGPMTVSYAVSAVDGNGYKKPGYIAGVNRTKGIDLEGRLSASMDHFTVGVGGYTGKLGKDVEGVPTFHTAQRFDAVGAYTSDRFRVGVEYFYAKDWNDVALAPPAIANTSEGIGTFASFKFNSQFSVFGRYDWVKPKRDTAPTEKENYFNVGVSYTPVKIVDFAIVYKRDKVDNGLFSTQNGTIGGLVEGTYDEVGLFSQLRW